MTAYELLLECENKLTYDQFSEKLHGLRTDPLFPPADSLSDAEKQFFAAIEKVVARTNDRLDAILDEAEHEAEAQGQKDFVKLTRAQREIIRQKLNMITLDEALTAAPNSDTLLDYLQKIEEAFAAKQLSPELFSHLKRNAAPLVCSPEFIKDVYRQVWTKPGADIAKTTEEYFRQRGATGATTATPDESRIVAQIQGGHPSSHSDLKAFNKKINAERTHHMKDHMGILNQLNGKQFGPSEFTIRSYKDMRTTLQPLASDDGKRFFSPGFLRAWSSNLLLHNEPVFKSSREAEEFYAVLAQSFHNLFVNMGCADLPFETIKQAMSARARKIAAHDKELRTSQKDVDAEQMRIARNTAKAAELEEGRNAARARQQAEEAATQQRIAQAAQKTEQLHRQLHDAFMAEHQPYPVEKDTGALAVLTALRNHTHSTANNAAHARLADQLLTHTAQALDIRQPGVRQLGELLLSAHGSGALAVAFGLGKLVPGAAKNNQLNATTKQLRTLSTAPAVQQAVEQLLADHESALLIALLTRPDTTCLTYANALVKAHNEISKSKTDIAAHEAAFEQEMQEMGANSAEDRALFLNDPDYALNKKLGLARDNLAKAEAEIAQQHGKLVDEIRLVVSGQKPKDVATSLVATSAAALEITGTTPPKNWDVSPETFAELTFTLKPGNTHIMQVASKEFPDKNFEIKADGSRKDFDKELGKLRAACEQYRANLVLLNDLQTHCGFEFTSKPTSPGDVASAKPFLLKHREYNIEVQLEAKDTDVSLALAAAKERFESVVLQQESLLQMLDQANVKITRGEDGAMTLVHNGDEPIAAAPRGYLSAGDFHTAHALLDRLNPAQPVSETAPASSTPAAWPPTNQTLMIFDANVLIKLAAKREASKGTWLDMLEQTSKLPNVKIVIPEVIAEWEMLGRRPNYDAQGNYTGSSQVDTRYANPEHKFRHFSEPMRQLIDKAARAHIRADGNVVYQPGSNNIVIMGTDGDHELYKRLSSIQRSDDKANRLYAEVHDHDEGEKAINRIIKALPWPTPVMLLTDDKRYLFSDDKPLRTAKDQPVHAAGSGAYLDAELSSPGRAAHLGRSLGEGSTISLNRIDNAVQQHATLIDSDGLSLMAHASRTKANGHPAVKHINQLLAEGWAQTQPRDITPAGAPATAGLQGPLETRGRAISIAPAPAPGNAK